MEKLFKCLVDALGKTKTINYIYFTVIHIVLGLLINHFSAFRYFIFHQLSLTFMITIGFFTDKMYLTKISEFIKTSKLTNNHIELRDKFGENIKSKYIAWFIIAIGIVFSAGVILLEYVNFGNLASVYCLILMNISVITSITLYSEYVILNVFLNDLQDVEFVKTDYVNMAPSCTEWLIKLLRISNNLTLSFLILGLMYTIHYALMIPKSFVGIKSGLEISTPSNGIFYLSWVVIFVVIVIGFPVLSYTQKNLFKNIIKSMKSNEVRQLNYLMVMCKEHLSSERSTAEEIKEYSLKSEYYSKLITEVISSNEDITARQDFFTIFSFISTMTIHFSTLFINANDILEKLLQ